jgi:Ala-tRNA(Pro) deacylase
MIPKKLLDYLENNKIKYEVIEHKTVYTAMDVAATQHLKPEQVVKTLVMKLDKDYALACLPANKNLDKAKFKKVVNGWRKKIGEKAVGKIDFAKEAWMKKNILGKVGATPPFGKLLGLPLFVDSAVLRNPKIVVNAGDYDYSLRLTSKAFVKLEEPVKGVFGKKK